MTPSRRLCLPACFLLLTALPACIVGPDVIGETLSAGELSASAGEPAELLQYGEQCELVADLSEVTGGEPEETEIKSSVLFHTDACESGMCLFQYDPPFHQCQTDADCDVPAAECGDNGYCTLSAAYVDEHTRCTRACETAADCPDTDDCASGYSCGVTTSIGPYCCEKVCVCNDALSVGAQEAREAMCATPEAENCF